jgi:hypothetical protein
MEIGIKEKMERMKVLAELWSNEDKKVFIKDVSDNWYFANILVVGEDTILVNCFSPKDRIGHQRIYWANIVKMEEYREVGK